MPALLPEAIELRRTTIVGDDPAAMPIDLPGLSGLDARPDVDGGWHGLWQSTDLSHQFWLAEPPPDGRATYCVVLPLDALLELRTEALLRIWRALSDRPIGEGPRVLPQQTRDRFILVLRALDGHLEGASYRQIAETLLGFAGTKADWEADSRKNQTRRLVADGLRYMRGGYRDLLRYPIHSAYWR